LLTATGGEAEREARAFARTLKQRIDEIADKYIRPDEGTYDFALMYIPAENVYYEAVLRAEDPGMRRASSGTRLRRRVIPVSPHTFYAYLLVILHGLKGMRVEQQAHEIQEQLGGLRPAVRGVWTGVQTVGAHLANARKRFERASRQAGGSRSGSSASRARTMEADPGNLDPYAMVPGECKSSSRAPRDTSGSPSGGAAARGLSVWGLARSEAKARRLTRHEI